jgi:hypothetical protein
MKSRRQFIQRCSSALLSASVLPVMGATVTAAPALSYSAFAPLVDTPFQLLSPTGAQIPVLLGRASLHTKPSSTLTDERNFTLKFTSQQAEGLGDGIHSFRHAQLGTVQMFVVETTAPNSDTKNYLATFQGAPVSSVQRFA